MTIAAGRTKTEWGCEPYDEKGLEEYLRKEEPGVSDLPLSSERTFLFTADGHIGVGSYQMELGDEVCVIFGCEVLCIIRPMGDHYRLIGECYVHGYMHGEAIDRWSVGELKDQWIDLQ
jgi:hypothetical protein